MWLQEFLLGWWHLLKGSNMWQPNVSLNKGTPRVCYKWTSSAKDPQINWPTSKLWAKHKWTSYEHLLSDLVDLTATSNHTYTCWPCLGARVICPKYQRMDIFRRQCYLMDFNRLQQTYVEDKITDRHSWILRTVEIPGTTKGSRQRTTQTRDTLITQA